MASLADIAKSLNSLESHMALKRCHSVLIYGNSKSGKTRLAATLAKVPSVKSIHWFDLENGSDTLVAMARDKILSSEQSDKIKLYKIFDTPQRPIGAETIIKAVIVGKPGKICDLHGRWGCPDCTMLKEKATWSAFDFKSLTSDDWIVIDSGSQLASSYMAYLMSGNYGNYDVKPGWDEFGPLNRMLTDLLSIVQAGAQCNFIVITHQLMLDKNELDKKLVDKDVAKAEMDQIFPLMGSKPFSLNVPKFFGHVIYTHMKPSKHAAGSSTTYKTEVVAGSRSGMKIEDAKEPDLSLVFDKLGLARKEEQAQTETNK